MWACCTMSCTQSLMITLHSGLTLLVHRLKLQHDATKYTCNSTAAALSTTHFILTCPRLSPRQGHRHCHLCEARHLH